METNRMAYMTVAESDAAEERRRIREEARQDRQQEPEGGFLGLPPVTKEPSVTVTLTDEARTTLKDPTWRERIEMRSRGEEPVKPSAPQPDSAKPSAFELVGTLPDGLTGRAPQIPKVRRQLAEFAKQNEGQWIRYSPSTEDPFKSVHGLAGQVRKGQAGFPAGFEAAVRGKQLYIRYVGEQPE
jgi:hypothetical protein